MEANQIEAFDNHLLSSSSRTSASVVDEFKIYFNLYGSLSLLFGIGLPLLWSFLLKDTESFSATRYKIVAYSHLFIWSPLASTFVFYFIFRTNYALDWVDSAMRFTVAGPWVIQLFAIYVLFAAENTSWSVFETLGVVSFISYNIGQMILQYVFIPKVAAYTTGFDAVPRKDLASMFQESKEDSKPAPDTDNLDYLNDTIEEAGGWPSLEYREATKA